MTKLTQADLEAALQDDRHLGYGYADAQYLSTTTRVRLDRLVLAEANALGWDAEELFQWTNSKYGRWTADSFRGPRLGKEAAREAIRATLNAEAAKVLKAGL